MNQPVYRIPSVDEVLGGETQGGVPRPAVSTDIIFYKAENVERRSIWSRIAAFFGA